MKKDKILQERQGTETQTSVIAVSQTSQVDTKGYHIRFKEKFPSLQVRTVLFFSLVQENQEQNSRVSTGSFLSNSLPGNWVHVSENWSYLISLEMCELRKASQVCSDQYSQQKAEGLAVRMRMKVKVWEQCNFGVWVFRGWNIYSWVSYSKRLSHVLFFKTFVLLFILLGQISSCFHLSRINKDNSLAVKKNIRFNHEPKSHSSPPHLLSTFPKWANLNSFTEMKKNCQSKLRVAVRLLTCPDHNFHRDKNKMINFKVSVCISFAFPTLYHSINFP